MKTAAESEVPEESDKRQMVNERRHNGSKRSRRKPVVSGAGIYGSSQMRAKERRRQRVRRQRMRAAAVLLLIVLALAGIGYTVTRGWNSKEKEKLLEVGISSMDSGNYEAAIQSFEEELALAGGRIGAYERQVLLYRAEAEYQLQDYAAALHTYEILLNEDHKNELYRKGAALCRMETGDYEGALELGVMDAEVYSRMAKAQMEQEQYEEALSSIEAGLAAWGQQNQNTDAQGAQEDDLAAKRHLEFQKAVVYEYLSDYKTALELFEVYVQQYGQDADAEREITFLKTRQGNY